MESKEEISQRHCGEWKDYRSGILMPAMNSGDEKEVKVAKALADAIRITQDGERRAFVFCEGRAEAADTALEIAWEEGQ